MKRFKVKTVDGAFSQIAGRTEELINQKEFDGYDIAFIYEVKLVGDAHAILVVFEAVDFDEVIPEITDAELGPVEEETETEEDKEIESETDDVE